MDKERATIDSDAPRRTRKSSDLRDRPPASVGMPCGLSPMPSCRRTCHCVAFAPPAGREDDTLINALRWIARILRSGANRLTEGPP